MTIESEPVDPKPTPVDSTSLPAVDVGMLHELLRSVQQFIYFKDLNRRFVRMSASCERLFQRKIDQLIGKREEDFLPREVAEVNVATEARVLGGTPLIGQIVRNDTRRGAPRWLSINKFPWYHDDGSCIGLFCVARDVTDVEERTEALRKEVARTRHLLGLVHLVETVAHELNNRLMVISVATDGLAERLPAIPESGKDIEALGQATDRARALVSQLADATLPRPFNERRIEVDAEIGALHGTLLRSLPSDVSLELRLGAADTPTWLDPAQLAEALTHLINDAANALQGGGFISISTAVAPDMAAVQLIVEGRIEEDIDTGVRDYEPLAQCPGGARREELTTVAAMLGGASGALAMEIGRHPEVRTSVRITLPTVEAVMHPEVRERPRRHGDRQHGTVLLLDDDPIVLAAVAQMLRRLGLSVIEASTGREATQLVEARNDEIDLFVCDVILHGERGPDVFESIRLRAPDIPVLYMSGFSPPLLRELGMRLQAGQVLRKPFTPAAFRRAYSRLKRRRPTAR